MKKLEATFSIVTPMFLGDADQQKAMGIRPPSIKGALRFWWRALNWARLYKTAENNESAALRLLHQEEARLFGLAVHEKTGGQGVFLLSVREKDIAPSQPLPDAPVGLPYLKGMGLKQRNCLPSGEFYLTLAFRSSVTDADIESISNALLMFGMVGGLGSRVRHGFGSVAMTAWSNTSRPLPATYVEYRRVIADLLPTEMEAALPPFTAFSGQTRIEISERGGEALELLASVGSQQQMYRSYGLKDLVNGKPAERNFSADHDLIFDAIKGKAPGLPPKRVVFGLPHNYRFSNGVGGASIDYWRDAGAARRASPLQLHIHYLKNEGFVAVHTLLPAMFLPSQAKIQIKGAAKTFYVPAEVDWKVLTGFLNRFPKKDVIYGQ